MNKISYSLKKKNVANGSYKHSKQPIYLIYTQKAAKYVMQQCLLHAFQTTNGLTRLRKKTT